MVRRGTQHPRGGPWRRRLAFVAVTALVAAAAGVVALRRTAVDPAPPVRVRVQAGSVDAEVEVPEGAAVGEVLAAAGVEPHDGVLRAAVSGEVLDADLDPAAFTLDGAPALASTPVLVPGVVTVVDGTDQVEETELRTEPIAPGPFPRALRHVHVAGRSGEREVEVGVRSGEVVRTEVRREPVDPAPAPGKVVALTFDDGPTEAWTPGVLDLLAREGVPATFCVVGTNVRRYPELLRRIVDEGHQTCNHTVDHATDLVGASQDRLDEQIGGGHDAIVEAGVAAPPYYRPPGGFLSDEIVATASALGEVTLFWQADPEDWRSSATAGAIIRSVLEQVEDGAIILLHDGGGHSRATTVQALAFLIPVLRAQGYEFTFPVIEPGS